MKAVKSAIAVGAALVLAQGVANAAPIIDQNNPSIDGGFCDMHDYGSFACGQSFMQTAGSISGAGIYIHPNWRVQGAVLTIGIFDAASDGNMLVKGTATNVSNESGWVDVFWKPLALTAGTQYYLRLSSSLPDLIAAFGDAGSYAKGNAIYGGTVYTQYDLAFRTYAGEPGPAVPEPASLGLLGLGLLGLAAARRRRAQR